MAQEEQDSLGRLSPIEIKMLELFSNHVADAKRIEEIVLLKAILATGSVSRADAMKMVYDKFGFQIPKGTIESCIRTINFEFIRAPQKVVIEDGMTIQFHADFLQLLQNDFFKLLFEDVNRIVQQLV